MIEAPKVKELLTGYVFEWEKDKLEIVVKRLRSHQDGRVTGDITLILGKAKQEEPSFSFNFSSSQTRKQLVNSLNEKFADWVWLEYIDELCRQIQHLALAGEPVKELWTSEDMLPPEYLLEPILTKDLPTIIFGEKGVTKSNLSLICYILLTLPWSDNPLGITAPERSIKTVVLDWELPGTVAQWNLKKLVEGMELGAIPLYHRHCSMPLADDIEKIQQYLEELQAEVIIIDSLGRAAGGDLSKDTENANRFFIALDKLKTTSLILAQTSKDKESKTKSIYGSVFFTYYARSIFELCKSESIDENEVNVALFHRYSNLSKLYKPIGFQFYFNGNKTRITSQPVTYGEFLDKVSYTRTLLEFLKDGAKSVSAIGAELELSDRRTRTLLSQQKAKHRVINLGSGLWGLLTNEE